MMYYKLSRKLWDKSNYDEDLNNKNPKVYPDVSASDIKDKYIRQLFTEKTINPLSIKRYIPVIDYFYCYNSTYDKEYDWILLDAYYLIGAEVPIDIRGFLVSKKLKDIMTSNQLILGSDHHFYPALLRYQGKFLEYYLFQYCYDSYEQIVWNEMSVLANGEEVKVLNSMDYYTAHRPFHRKQDFSGFHSSFVFKAYSDILILPSLGYTVITESFKNALVENSISGFQIDHLDYLNIKFKDR